jgi:PadR family transcriptional regulator, regulatory protein PadR
MNILTKPEELLLLAICNLKENAYGVEILKYVSEKTGSEWSIGSIYVPLDRLARLGYVETYLGEATAKRGGKKKRYFKITKFGLETLVENKRINDEMWSEMSDLATE